MEVVEKLAVEVEGPSHYTRNAPFKMMGATRLRTRFLERRGWCVLSVPFYEWDPLMGNDAAKYAYLELRVHAGSGLGGAQ